MNKKFFWKYFLVTMAVLLSATASADNQGFYIGAAAAHLSDDFHFQSHLDEDTGLKIFGGFSVLKWLAVEADYVDFGRASGDLHVNCTGIVAAGCPNGVGVDANAFSVSALAIWALPMVDVYGRAGLSHWKAKFSTEFSTGPDASDTERGTDPTYGAGAAVKLGSWSLRAEYEHFKLGRDSIKVTSAGVSYTF